MTNFYYIEAMEERSMGKPFLYLPRALILHPISPYSCLYVVYVGQRGLEESHNGGQREKSREPLPPASVSFRCLNIVQTTVLSFIDITSNIHL